MVDNCTAKSHRKAVNIVFGLGIRVVVGRFEVDTKVNLFSARDGSMVLLNDGCG
jgi:hypothetical protein